MRSSTRREYRRLLVNYALTYFDREMRVRDLDRVAVQHFVDWLTMQPGRDGRLCDRSISNALTPLRPALDAAVAEGLLDANPAEQVVLPRRCAGRAWSMRERRYLTRAELVRLLEKVPVKWRSLFEVLAATGLRISEAVGLRWSDLILDGPTPHLHVRRAIVKGAVVAPKSRHGARLIPLTVELAPCCALAGPRALQTTSSCPPAAPAACLIRGACVAACSSPPRSVRAYRGSGSTRCATPAPRC
ncbi:MAG: tyrosine-type recombinase/integrase [Thermoleophilaceae bacterium]